MLKTDTHDINLSVVYLLYYKLQICSLTMQDSGDLYKIGQKPLIAWQIHCPSSFTECLVINCLPNGRYYYTIVLYVEACIIECA